MATESTPDVNSQAAPAAGMPRRAGMALALAVVVLCGGCAHKAAHYTAPDAAALNARQAEVATHLAAAQTHLGRAGAALTDAQQQRAQSAASHSREDVLVAEIAPKLAELKMRVTAELRPEVDALSAQVAQLSLAAAETDSAIMQTGAKVADGVKQVLAATSEITDAKTAQADIVALLGPSYQGEVAVLAQRANDAEQGWAADSAKLHTSFLYKIVAALCVVLLVAGVVLKFTGRLALNLTRTAV